MTYVPGQNAPAASTDFAGTGDNVGPSGGEDSFLNLTAKEAKLSLILKRGVPMPANISPAQALLYNHPEARQQTTTAGDELSRFYTMGSDELASLQNAMVQVPGLYTNAQLKNLRLGVPDEASYAAYHKIVRRAVLGDQTIDEVLGAFGPGGAAGAGAGGSGGSTRAPLTISLTNPTDVHFVANKVGQSLLGRNLNDQELAQITSAFQGQEASSQRQAYNKATGGTATAAPNAQAFAEQQVRAQNPTEAGAHDVAGTFDAFLQLIGGQVK